MPRISVTVDIDAPIERVFDLARSIDIHKDSQTKRQEKAIAGRTTGLVELNDTVTWEAIHLGVRQKLTSRIGILNRPTHFRDSMVSGAFKRFDHDHKFEICGSGTRMTDVFDYTSPLGPLGRIADRLFLKRYMTRFLREKGEHLKRVAESADEWQQYLGD